MDDTSHRWGVMCIIPVFFMLYLAWTALSFSVALS